MNRRLSVFFFALAFCTACITAAGARSGSADQLPVGYSNPASDSGGPQLDGGLRWIEKVWPRTVKFADRLREEKPTVMFITNYGGVDTVHELARRFPVDVVHLHPDIGDEFPGRSEFFRLLNSREKIDCFVLSRFNHRTIPADIQYEILRRVREGAGLVVVDCYDRSKTFRPKFLNLKPTESDPRLIRGIPYDGLRQWKNTESKHYVSFNYWNTRGGLEWNPQAQPYEYGSVKVYSFGEGRMVRVSTDTHWARARRSGRTLLPHVQQNRSMWAETDYYYSHTAKCIRKAVQQRPIIRIERVVAGADGVALQLHCNADEPVAATVWWQVRDTWGIVENSGRNEMTIAAEQNSLPLEDIAIENAGRHFVDVWIVDGNGRTIDWGSGFADIEASVPSVDITLDHPEGTPRGTPLSGTIRLQQTADIDTVRLILVDRYWRQVFRKQMPANDTELRYSFSTAGLDGQVWTLKVDLFDGDGRIIARGWQNITSPHSTDSLPGFQPIMTCCGMACPEEAARREYLRRLGFIANRPYTCGNPLMAQAHAWNDIQMHSFPFNVRGADSDYKSDRINDREAPIVKAEHEQAMKRLTKWMRPYGLHGYNFTDDSSPAKELPPSAYTTQKFHEWLKEEYGDINGLIDAWNLHQREFHSFARVHRKMIKAEYDAGNTAPWIDAQRFLQELWVEHIVDLRAAARSVGPDIYVGSDAGYYGAAMSDMFGKLDYLAPYYRDGRGVKVAVSRGASRRDGTFGACLGSYGEKPADMSGRRGKIWDILFAGGTGLYYWMFPGNGMSEDMVLSDKHARYQCEVIEQVTSGIGELFTDCERVFDPIAILDSRTSAICDQLEKKGRPLTTQVNSIGAFQYICEDLCLNPHIITTPELENGWLAENGMRLLILPGVNSLSDAEVEAVRSFVDGGGTVVSDILPGRRLPNGNVRAAPPLPDLFGVRFDADGKPVRLRGRLRKQNVDFGPGLADPRVHADTAAAAGTLSAEGNGDGQASAEALFSNEYGSGKAYLFNASFSTYTSYRAEAGGLWKAWPTVFREIAAQADITPQFTFTAGGEARGIEVSPFRNGNGYLVGVADLGFGAEGGRKRSITVDCPDTYYIYEMRAGELMNTEPTSRIKDTIPARGHRAYCLLPYTVDGVDLSANTKQVRRGETVTVEVRLRTGSGGARCVHVIRLRARTPEGEFFYPFKRVIRLPAEGPLTIPLKLAHNDPAGEWTFIATDINSGASAQMQVTVGGEG